MSRRRREKINIFSSPKAVFFFGAFLEGNGLLGEVVVGKIDFLIFFADFWSFLRFLCIFIVHCGNVFGHFSDIFGIRWDCLGYTRELFRRMVPYLRPPLPDRAGVRPWARGSPCLARVFYCLCDLPVAQHGILIVSVAAQVAICQFRAPIP